MSRVTSTATQGRGGAPGCGRDRFLYPGMIRPFAVIVLCFAAWGLAGNMTDPLVAVFGSVFSMSAFQSSLVQFAYYGAYFMLAIPAAWLNARLGYKGGVLIGLGLAAVGGYLFFPAASLMTYGWFLAALFTLAAGLSILETSANPYVMAMGPESTATRRLNFAQAFNPVGSNLGVMIAGVAILPFISEATVEQRAAMGPDALRQMQSGELQAVMGPYLGLATLYLIIAVAIALVKVPKNEKLVGMNHPMAPAAENLPGTVFSRLISNRLYRFGVIAQFFNIAVQTCVWTFIIHYGTQVVGLDNTDAGKWLQASVLIFLVGRFAMVVLMGRFDPRKLMLLMTVIGLGLSIVAVVSANIVGMIAVVLLSGCFALLFPTIYAVSLQGVGADVKWGAAGLVMAIIGGAVVPPLQGALLDATSVPVSFLIVVGGFAAIVAFALYTLKGGAERPSVEGEPAREQTA